MNTLTISNMKHTWLIDIDGTIFKHNGYKDVGGDEMLPGVLELWNSIPENDTIILLSARKQSDKNTTLAAMDNFGLRYDFAIFDLPYGERILINDKKPKGLETALSLNINRDEGMSDINITVDKSL